MPSLTNLFRPASYARFAARTFYRALSRLNPNLRGATFIPAGSYYSPLIDIGRIHASDTGLPEDGPEYWEHLGLDARAQQAYYRTLLEEFPLLPFPSRRTDGHRFYKNNGWFSLPDAFLLSGIIRREKPRRIVEVGSGFSSAVMLDTLGQNEGRTQLTFIEPNPGRLYSVLSEKDKMNCVIVEKNVQEVPLSLFQELEENDILFIDSSHVAKIGSDVTFLLLRVLPLLKSGVLVHFHDIFYPFSYPLDWIREGRAWNESLFLRAFLAGNPSFTVFAFNSFAIHSFPELFRPSLPEFIDPLGSSIWIRKS